MGKLFSHCQCLSIDGRSRSLDSTPIANVFLVNKKWRQWRRPRTKVRALIKLGVSERLAIACGITSKGPWRSAKTKGINIAISDAFLARQGLLSLRETWINIHYS